MIDLSRFTIRDLICARQVCDEGHIGCFNSYQVWDWRTRTYVVASVEEVEAEIKRQYAANRAHFLVALSKMHTRQLLKWLTYTHMFGGWYAPSDDHTWGVSADDIKAELAKRPHIPNKKEARAARQEAARQARKGKRG